MLRRTFLHLPGVGETTERRWWERGVRDWETALAAPCREDQRNELLSSLAALERKDWTYFERALANVHKWRAWEELGGQALFVDIETNGSYGPQSITVIGTFDGREVRHFVAEENLQDAADHLESFPMLVTFNGLFFDMPLIRQRFTHRLNNHLHLDLRFPLHRLGLKGGLKRIEQQLGLVRGEATDGLGGWDAVRLWREWQYGSRESRELLLEYNSEDVRNLRPLAEYVHARMSANLPSTS
ncbi:MAG TPA: ribonuclease H-like domain-containing protein [Kiritimatiellia bacterium]|nr:ribonuclease H-like domain-containing protein [Kiritimatiellia bacterium]